MSKLLTISIAAYNVEKTIGECLDSFLQSRYFDELEILVINDGSHDRTADIVSMYEKEYPQSIRLINKVNGGHGSTLNTSLKVATGEFYKAVDGDDWVNSIELDKLCDWLNESNSDLVIDDYLEVYPDHTRLISCRNDLLSRKNYRFNEFFYNKKYNKYFFVLSNSTIRTSRLREVGMKIQENCYYADTELYFFIGLAARTISFADSCVYRYRLGNNGQSVSPEGIYNHIEDFIKIELNLMSLYNENLMKIDNPIRRQYLFSIIDTRFSMLLDCFTRIIQKDDKDFLLVDFLEKVEMNYSDIESKCTLSWVNKYIITVPQKRIRKIRYLRNSYFYKMVQKIRKFLKIGVKS